MVVCLRCRSGKCSCGKSAKKSVRVPKALPAGPAVITQTGGYGASAPQVYYRNKNDTTYSLGMLVLSVEQAVGHLFDGFTVAEDEDGQLLIKTGLMRNLPVERLIHDATGPCEQPCSGDCEENACSAKPTV